MSKPILAVTVGTLGFTSIAIGSEPTSVTEKEPIAVTSPAYLNVVDGRSNPYSIPPREAMWALFAMVNTSDDQRSGSGQEILSEHVGLTAERSDVLADYILSAYTQYRATARQVLSEMCSLRASLTSRAALAAALVEMDRQMDIERDLYVMNLAQVLDNSETNKVTAWVNFAIRPSLQITSVDHAQYLEAENVDPRSTVRNMCP